MRWDLELDVWDLASALRVTPNLSANDIYDLSDIYDPLLVRDSIHLINDDFILCIQNSNLLRPLRKRLVRRDYVTFQFTQSGGYRLSGDGQIRRVRSGSVRLNAMPVSVSEFREQTTIRGASIFVERGRLIDHFGLRPDLWREEYRAAFSRNGSSSVSIEMPLTPEMWLILDAIADCSFREPVRTLYFTAKATELVSLSVVQFNGLARSGASVGLDRSARERRLIEAAALVYRRELSQPPSIDVLSRRIGLNRNKLTNGFRCAFGMTPAEYSRQLRLEWAARRLSEGLDVRQVAATVGYDSVAAFGRAFRKRFGYAPSKQASNGWHLRSLSSADYATP